MRLSELSHGAGCGCKLPAAAVRDIVADLPAPDDPRLLVGPGTADDAGVWRVSDDLALVQYRETVDPKSPAVTLLSPSGTEHPLYAERFVHELRHDVSARPRAYIPKGIPA